MLKDPVDGSDACMKLLYGHDYLNLTSLGRKMQNRKLVIYHTFFDPLRNVPGPWWAGFTSLPYSIKRLQGDISSYAKDLHKIYGPVVRISPEVVSVHSATDVRKIMSSYRYPKTKSFEDVLLSENMFSTTSESHNRTRRKQVGPAFSHTGLANIEDDVMESGIVNLKERLERMLDQGKDSFNYFSMFQSVTADVISMICFGRSFNILKTEKSPFLDCFRSTLIYASIVSAAPMLHQVPFIMGKLRKETDIMLSFVHDSIMSRREGIESGEISKDRMDVLQMFLNSTNPDGSDLTEKEIFSETFLMLAAGTDAIAMSLTATMHMLTLYPEVFEKVRNEVRSTFTDRSKLIRYTEAKDRLPYFVATVYESIRLLPIAGGLVSRDSSSEGVVLSGIKIPKNVKLGLYFEGANRDPGLYKSPESFDPTRYLGPEGDLLKKETFSFSHGVRICPGRK
ncbi:Isotrichodermin C-15 hydroxylase [Smittium mucronatum]|uniref:Isotrichodermin C-15 hydroxylase n=1 Tax=Smittium mucronatum TaxID=133383 RepID=A0A1R0H5T7_9FUNG|nr:Isotrichodermin C-15 hydroxylase [Smittium mucronatum]